MCDAPLSLAEYASQFGASGYVVDSVPLAALAMLQPTGPLETIGEIVRCGGDTDTIASMYGHIYGAGGGVSKLPATIVDCIDEIALIRTTAAELSRVSLHKLPG